MVDVSQSFGTSSETVSNFFQTPGLAFYIPLYQREYSWDQSNIDQLMEDICQGVISLLDAEKRETVIHFLGTLILVEESEQNIYPKDRRALPTRADNVIDGQQRISTIALLACLLYQKLYQLQKKLSKKFLAEQKIQEIVDTYLEALIELFSFDLKRGFPRRKPIIIRGSVDCWTYEGEDDKYLSDVASFIASFIRAIEDDKSAFPKLPKHPRINSILKTMNSWIKKVEKAYEESDNEDFPPATKIVEGMDQRDLWSYERQELASLVKQAGKTMNSNDKTLCSMVQLFAFCHYLLERCCFTLIKPASDDWAFDMFQSLNATATPLTALETFKPLVVNYVNSAEGDFKISNSSKYLETVDKLLSPLNSASSKNKLTNEYLTLFALTYNGDKLTRQFSAQRQWLNREYNHCDSVEASEAFILELSYLATYLMDVDIDKIERNNFSTIPRTESTSDSLKKEAALCVMYLQDAGHKMSKTVLSRFYSLTIRDDAKDNAAFEFVSACRAIAAFFTLWRSALPNKGLDNVYRILMKENISFKKGNDNLNSNFLKKFFIEQLESKKIKERSDWKKKAMQWFKYENQASVCKFALLVTSHNTIPDPDVPGLMKIGTPGSSPSYLEAAAWMSEAYKTIEHIAPQKPDPDQSSSEEWDSDLYENDDYDRIGNLLLLPTEINSSASNKSWTEKYIYYQHLGEQDPGKLKLLEQQAKEQGINLDKKTIDLLRKTPRQHHIKPIVELGLSGQWDKSLVDQRTERICDILWDRMMEWLT
jgi:hypothetical protein